MRVLSSDQSMKTKKAHFGSHKSIKNIGPYAQKH